MIERERPPLADLRDEIGSLRADLTQMVRLRGQLARLEVEAALGQIKRLAIAGVIFGVMLLAALPILVVAAAWVLGDSQTCQILFGGWLLIFGLGLLIAAVAGGWWAWRRFRRRFVGIEQTLEELREDAVWLRERVGRGEESKQT